jgi:FAD/FMN-containing dehydrogenase
MAVTRTIRGRARRNNPLALLDGKLFHAEHGAFDHARQAWNLAVDQRPAAVVAAESPADVAATVSLARAHGLRVAAQGTGHGAAALGPLEDTILV